MIHKLSSWATALCVAAGPLLAQTDMPELAEAGLQTRLDALGSAKEHAFERGLMQTLRAVERALQTGYSHGLTGGMIEIPVLRVIGGQMNPDPVPTTPDSLAKGVTRFLADLDLARSALAAIPEGSDQSVILTLQDLWFDIDGDGIRSDYESVLVRLAPEILGWRGMRAVAEGDLFSQPITIRFDAADQAWLTAYTHMLSGFGEAILAFDPAPVIADLQSATAALGDAPEIPNAFDQDAAFARLETMEAELDDLAAKIATLQGERKAAIAQRREIATAREATEDATEIAALDAQTGTLTTRLAEIRNDLQPLYAQRSTLMTDIRAEEAKITSDPLDSMNFREGLEFEIDSIYLLIKTLRQTPDAGHVQAVRDHWKAMIAHNREFWTRLPEETDNDREWIPNALQTSALPLDLPDGIGERWLSVLDDAERVLDGALLVPHPLLPRGYGINIGAWFDNPSSLDLVDWIHGRGAYPYAARGPFITDRNWLMFNEMVSGNAGSFAIFLN